MARVVVCDGAPVSCFGFHANLPAEEQAQQTISRAELFAWVLVAFFVDWAASFEIVTDSWSCIQGFRCLLASEAVSREIPNGDLWWCLFRILDARRLGRDSLTLKWVKSHLVEKARDGSLEELAEVVPNDAAFSVLDVFGTQCVDALAARSL